MIKKQKSFIISFFVVFTLFVVIVSLCTVYGFTARDTQSIKFGRIAETANEAADVLSETELSSPIDNTIFLGESTTYGLQRYGVLKDGCDTNQVWTGAAYNNGKVTSAGTMSLNPAIEKTKIYYPDTGEALTVSEALLKKSPEYLVITLGLNNGASYYSESQFKSCYKALLESIKVLNLDTTVILQSIFPVSAECSIKAYTPNRIKECNKWINEIAQEHGLKYLDTHGALADENGYLREEYDNKGDGIHLNAQGLIRVVEFVKENAYAE